MPLSQDLCLTAKKIFPSPIWASLATTVPCETEWLETWLKLFRQMTRHGLGYLRFDLWLDLSDLVPRANSAMCWYLILIYLSFWIEPLPYQLGSTTVNNQPHAKHKRTYKASNCRFQSSETEAYQVLRWIYSVSLLSLFSCTSLRISYCMAYPSCWDLLEVQSDFDHNFGKT